MNNRWFWSISIWLMFFLVLLGGVLRPSKKQASSKVSKQTKVGIVLSVGGRGDQSFNDSAYEGLMRAQKLFKGVTVRYSEPRENAAAKQDLESFARQGFDLIIGVGFLMARAVKEVAQKYPKQKFAIIDSVVSLPNVASLVFQEHEGSYLAGILAALATKTGIVGFLGGMNIPLIKKFEAGFRQGVIDTNPKLKVLVGYLGASPKAFHDPAGGEKLTMIQFGKGADIIFHAAGSSGLGAIKAARSWNQKHPLVNQRRYIIGVDGNQDHIAKGSVLTSMVKRVDIAVFETIKNLLTDQFEGRLYRYGLQENGVGITDCKYSQDRLPKSYRTALAKARLAILRGTLKVPATPEQVKVRTKSKNRKPSTRKTSGKPSAPR